MDSAVNRTMVMLRAGNQRWLAYASLLVLSAIWGGTFFIVKDATREFPVLAFLVVRFFIACLFLIPLTVVAFVRLRYRPPARHWAWGIFAGVLYTAGFVFQTFALRLIDSGRAGFITGLYVVFVPFLAFVFLRYPVSLRVMLGAALAVLGMFVLGYAPGGTPLGDLLAVACAFSFAAHIVVIERMPRDADWRFMALVQAVTVMILSGLLLPFLASLQGCTTDLCVALQPFKDPIPTELPGNVLAAAAFTGFFATAVGLSVQVWAQRILPPSDAALIYALESPFSVVFGVLFLAEILTGAGVLGSGLIFAGVLVVTLLPSNQHPHAAESATD